MFIFFDFSDLPFLCLHNTYPHPIDWFGSIFLFLKSNPHFRLDFYEFHVIFAIKIPLFHMFIHIYTSVRLKFQKNHSCLFPKCKYFFPCHITTLLYWSAEFSHNFVTIRPKFPVGSGTFQRGMLQYIVVGIHWLIRYHPKHNIYQFIYSTLSFCSGYRFFKKAYEKAFTHQK